MFKKSQRLTKREFDTFFKVGKRHHFKHFTLISAPSPDLKVAVVVGKKVSKNAVKRNLLKRRVYGAVKSMQKTKETNMVLIFLAKPSLITLTRKTVNVAVTTAVAEVFKTA